MPHGRAAIGCAFALTGCAATVREDWGPEPRFPELPAYHFEVAESDLPRVCGAHPAGGRVLGCALRHFADGLCIIYTRPRPAAWLLDHERRHCAGWDHGGAESITQAYPS